MAQSQKAVRAGMPPGSLMCTPYLFLTLESYPPFHWCLCAKAQLSVRTAEFCLRLHIVGRFPKRPSPLGHVHHDKAFLCSAHFLKPCRRPLMPEAGLWIFSLSARTEPTRHNVQAARLLPELSHGANLWNHEGRMGTKKSWISSMQLRRSGRTGLYLECNVSLYASF